MERRLTNARDYFDNITAAAYQQFMGNEVTFLTAYSMASGLFHIAEWIWQHDGPKVQAKFGQQIGSHGDLWRYVESLIPDGGLIRDMNNAAKHVKLSFDPNKPTRRDPSTTMYYAANTSISSTAWSDGSFGHATWGGAPEVKLDEGGRQVPLAPIATAVFKFWEDLMDEFHPRPPQTFSVDLK
jgi:hypothetical protein